MSIDLEASMRTALQPGHGVPLDAPMRDNRQRDYLKGLCRAELRAMVLELRRRRLESPYHLAVMTPEEQRVGAFVVATLKATVEQLAAEHPAAQISLKDLTSETLRQIMEGSRQ